MGIKLEFIIRDKSFFSTLKIFLISIFLIGIISYGFNAVYASESSSLTLSHNSTKLDPINSINTPKSNVLGSKSSYKVSLPRKFDLRTVGRVSPVKDQGDAGTCWTFATMGSLESCLLPTEKWNFSENNIKNLLSNLYPGGYNREYDSGGDYTMALSYLARYDGPVTAAMDPYNTHSGYSPPGLKPVKHLQQCLIIPISNTPTANNPVKYALFKYGAVASLINSDILQNDSPYYNKKYYASYFPGSKIPRFNQPNHAICIVGWDDDFDRNKFKVKPPGNGAFIIKNSWGTKCGDKGYYYISYYDRIISLCPSFVFMGLKSPTNYQQVYQYDTFGWIGEYGFKKNSAWFSNVFKASKNSKLAAISFYALKNHSSYEIYIYKKIKKETPTKGILLKKITGKTVIKGYYTISLGSYPQLLKGDVFSVVVKLTSPGTTWPIAIEYPNPLYTTKARARAGQSYVSSDGRNWKDLTRVIKNANVCLKAFTI